MKPVDVNCDMGESIESVRDGSQESLMPYVTSVNVACGGHAGDEESMAATIAAALKWKLAVGAHPGYPDRSNFGRVSMKLDAEDLSRSIFGQIRALWRVAEGFKVRLLHVKPHGALYNDAAKDPAVARAVAEGVALFSRELVLVGLARSRALGEYSSRGFAVAAEAFADRRYEPDGSLRPRSKPDALILDPAEAAAQALAIARENTAQTICVHSDTPGARAILAAVAARLDSGGIVRRALTIT